MSKPTRRHVSTAELAELLGVGVQTVRERIERGVIPAKREHADGTGRWRIAAEWAFAEYERLNDEPLADRLPEKMAQRVIVPDRDRIDEILEAV